MNHHNRARTKGLWLSTSQSWRNRFAWTIVLCVAAIGTSAQAALTFNLTSTGNVDADAGFAEAAAFLSATFNDPIEVNITAGFASLGGSILGQASSTSIFHSFTSWKTAVFGDITSTDDTTFSANLPGGSSYSVYINRTTDNPNGSGSDTPYLHGGVDEVRLTRANAKALGLLPGNDAGEDAGITFNSDFSWDFNPDDGIDAGKIDFVGVAMHELIHAMGFISGVDILDYNAPDISAAAYDGYARGLDFTRHSDDSLAAGADMDWAADTRDKEYSIDGGTTTLLANAWSTGVNFGDGRQASHWKDHLGIGIMDPTSAPAGSANVFTAYDKQALDVIGWNTLIIIAIPAPMALNAGLALLLLAFVCVRRVGRCH